MTETRYSTVGIRFGKVVNHEQEHVDSPDGSTMSCAFLRFHIGPETAVPARGVMCNRMARSKRGVPREVLLCTVVLCIDANSWSNGYDVRCT